jgi:hypothetical protein
MRVLDGWMKQMINLKRLGYTDQECCNAAGVTMRKLTMYFENDVEFKKDYNQAKDERRYR